MENKRTRTQAEMLTQIMAIAEADPRVRAVVLNGSRVDPAVTPDPFQDYDVIYAVTAVEPFLAAPDWIGVFGEMLIMQTPDDMGEAAARRSAREPRDSYTWLMQFADGNRIDLTCMRTDRIDRVLSDSLSRTLLDKDGLLPPLPPADDRSYHVRPPTNKQFDDCCNEFLWVSPYVAKALWREQAVGARVMLEQLVRPQLHKMLAWHVGARSGYTRSVGSYYKRLDTWVEPRWRRLLASTLPGGDPDQVWDALLSMGRLFRLAAREMASQTGFIYPEAEHRRVMAFLRHIRRLPRDARRIY